MINLFTIFENGMGEKAEKKSLKTSHYLSFLSLTMSVIEPAHRCINLSSFTLSDQFFCWCLWVSSSFFSLFDQLSKFCFTHAKLVRGGKLCFCSSIKTFSIIRSWEQAQSSIRNGWGEKQNWERKTREWNNVLIFTQWIDDVPSMCCCWWDAMLNRFCFLLVFRFFGAEAKILIKIFLLLICRNSRMILRRDS